MGTDGRLILVSGGLVWVLLARHYGELKYFSVKCAKLIPSGRPAAEAWVQMSRTYLAECASEHRDIRFADWLSVDGFATEEFWDFAEYGDIQATPADAMGLQVPEPYNFCTDVVINLDLLYFGVSGYPVYSILNVPSTANASADLDGSPRHGECDLWRYLGYDLYGHRTWAKNTPTHSRYQYDQGPFPQVTPSAPLLRDFSPASTQKSPGSLLGPFRWRSSDEDIRVNLLQSFVGMLMGYKKYYPMLRVGQIRQDVDSHHWRWAAESLLRIASLEKYDLGDRLNVQMTIEIHENDIFNVDWPRENVCVHYARYLDEPAHMDSGIACVIKLARSRYTSGSLWGVVFSAIHCVIVRIDARPGRSCVHTSALQFLPDWDDDRLDTVGIVALAQLFHIPPAPPLDTAKVLSPYHTISRLPVEIIHQIVGTIEQASDVWALAHAVPGLVNTLGNRLRRSSYVGKHRPMKFLPSTRPSEDFLFLCVDEKGVYTQRFLFAKQGSSDCRENYRMPLASRQGTWTRWVSPKQRIEYYFWNHAFELWFCIDVDELTEGEKATQLSHWLKDVTPRPTTTDFARRQEHIRQRWDQANEAWEKEYQELLRELVTRD